MKNYYAILEVAKDATRDEIKRAYINHICFISPDRFDKDTPERESAASMLLNINEAYACLGDPEKRMEYDALLSREAGSKSTGARGDTAAWLTPFLALVFAFLIMFHLFSKGTSNESAFGSDTDDGTVVVVPAAPPAQTGGGVTSPQGNPTNSAPDESKILASISKERPSNRATSTNTYEYLQLSSDEFYEILLEADSTEIYDNGNIAALWTKHVQSEEQQPQAEPKNPDQTDAGKGNIGWFIKLDAYNLEKETTALLKIMYYDKNGKFIGGSDVSPQEIRWTKIKAGSGRNTFNWVKAAVQATEKHTDQHKRALLIAGRIKTARDLKLESEYSHANKKIKNYAVKKGGTITAKTVFCRKIPTPGSSIIRGKLIKNTPVFVTRRYKDENGRTWYYIEHINAKGWLAGNSVRVY